LNQPINHTKDFFPSLTWQTSQKIWYRMAKKKFSLKFFYVPAQVADVAFSWVLCTRLVRSLDCGFPVMYALHYNDDNKKQFIFFYQTHNGWSKQKVFMVCLCMNGNSFLSKLFLKKKVQWKCITERWYIFMKNFTNYKNFVQRKWMF
jgi:hypothetical protein